MTLDAAIDSYRNDLHERHYSAADMERKQNLLRRWLSYAVALHQPGLPSRLLKMTEIRLYGGRGVVGAAGTAERHAAVAEFLNWWRTADANVRHVALATLIDQYRREQLAGRADEARRRRAVDDFCRGLGLELALRSMAANTYRQALGWLRAQRIERAATYSATFFVYCGEHGWLSFQPPSRTVREPYQQVFDAEFLGTDGGLWSERLRRYLEYLKSERNLSDGGIDYYVRKLKVFVEWLNASAEAEPTTVPAIKRFLSERHRQGCKLSTVAKHLYALRVFFEFLVDKGIIDSNPALELSLRADPAEPQETLTQLEVAQLIEFLEDQQRASRERLEAAVQSTHHVRERVDAHLDCRTRGPGGARVQTHGLVGLQDTRAGTVGVAQQEVGCTERSDRRAAHVGHGLEQPSQELPRLFDAVLGHGADRSARRPRIQIQ